MKGGWQGFVVKRKGPNSKKDVTISGHFETQGGAHTFMEMAKKAEPQEEFYVCEHFKKSAAK